MTEPVALTDAQAAVLAAIDQAVSENKLAQEAAEDLRQQVPQHTTLFALDDQLVFDHPVLKWHFCRFPECFSPPRPADKPGQPPAYCVDGRDDEGRPHDDPQRSRRRRRTLRGEFVKATATGRADVGGDSGLDRPVSLARETVAVKVESIAALIGKLVIEMQELRATAERTADEEQRFAEIENIQTECNRLVSQETRLRLEAEKKQRELQKAHDKMASDLQENNAATEQAETMAEAMREERNTAIEERKAMKTEAEATVAEAKKLAEFLIAEAQWKAEQEVAKAQSAFDTELAKHTKAMNDAVDTANTQRTEALTEVAEREKQVELREATAKQSVLDAEAVRDKAVKDATKLGEDNTELRENAIKREREHTADFTKQTAKYEREMGELRGKLEDLAAKRERETADHNRELRKAQTDFDDALVTQISALRAELETTYGTQISSLTETNQLLTQRAKRAEEELKQRPPHPPAPEAAPE